MWTRTGLVCVLLAAPLMAAELPNFTGKWKLNESRTKGGNHRGTVFVIEHKDPAFRYTATGTLRMGGALNESYEFTTDGKKPAVSDRVSAVGSWQGSTLVTDYLKGNAPLMTFTFRLSPDGKQLFRDAELKDGRRIHEVYDRQ
ncbi:MAG TPA: hypothetical protein VGK29_13930 [Paludibaculum sp.]|jgi:hypothetical protein